MTRTGNTKLIKVALAILIGILLRLLMAKLGWLQPWSLPGKRANLFDYDVEWNRVIPAFILWLVFFVYWAIASGNSSPTQSSESRVSSYLHQFVLNVALVLLFWPAPGLTGWFLPRNFHFLVAMGATVQAGFLLLGVWARRHLGCNWSAEVRIAVGHELVRTGPYRLLRHPIYTAMLGMFLGTAIASSQYHALVGLGLLVVAYVRKTRMEEQVLLQTFGSDYDAYRRNTWALAPLLF